MVLLSQAQSLLQSLQDFSVGWRWTGESHPAPALCPHSGAENTEKPHGYTCLPGHIACVILAADTAPRHPK